MKQILYDGVPGTESMLYTCVHHKTVKIHYSERHTWFILDKCVCV